MAAWGNRLEVAELLLEAGASVVNCWGHNEDIVNSLDDNTQQQMIALLRRQ